MLTALLFTGERKRNKSVVKFTRGNKYVFFINFINKPVFLIYPPRPESGELIFQGLRLAEALKGGAFYVFDEGADL